MLVKFDLRIITQSYIADLWVNKSAILGKIMWRRLRHVHRLGETFTFKQILSARDWSSFVHAQVNIFGSLLLLWLVYYVSQHCHERFTWDTLYSLEFAMNYHAKTPDMNAAKQSPKTAAIHVLSQRHASWISHTKNAAQKTWKLFATTETTSKTSE